VQKRPEVPQQYLWFWTAYWDLCTERQPGGLIPMSKVREYAHLHGMPYTVLRGVVQGMES
jgi:hypothetical protein